MNYCELKKCDIADGPGVRVSLFVAGCHRHCKGCHNANTWDFNSGAPITSYWIFVIDEALSESYISGFTILGGEPFDPENAMPSFEILRHIREKFPNKSIWAYSGYTYEELSKLYPNEIRELVDVLVDGPYIEEQRDISLRFRGSRNQRIIDVPKTVQAGHIVLWENKIENDPEFNMKEIIDANHRV